MDLLPSNVIEAQIAKMEQDEIIIRALKKKNERLAAERLEAELEASIEIAKAKFAQAQAFQRMKAVEDDLNQLRNWIAGNVVQRDQEYENLRSNVSYLMGAHAP
jgi:hypothetical protein